MPNTHSIFLGCQIASLLPACAVSGETKKTRIWLEGSSTARAVLLVYLQMIANVPFALPHDQR